MKSTVYCLFDKKTDEPIYVGSTSNSLKKRLCVHRVSLRKSKAPVYKHIREHNIDFDIKELEQFECKHIGIQLIRESKWYYRFISDGVKLYNKFPPVGYENGGKIKDTVIVKMLADGIGTPEMIKKLKLSKSKFGLALMSLRYKYQAKSNSNLVAIFLRNNIIQ